MPMEAQQPGAAGTDTGTEMDWNEEDQDDEDQDVETLLHTIIRFFLYDLINDFAGFLNLGVVLAAPFEMQLNSGQSPHSPDLLFVRRSNLNRLTPERLDGPADLVVEIVSDHRAPGDDPRKLWEYQQAGVPEYWIVDPRPGSKGGAFYHLTPEGFYAPILPDAFGHRASSRVLPGFWLPGGWLWESMFPTWVISS
ncbi:MAG: Uma2 family endonuclease [Chloroflexaceae bacterium]|nr:Uma2 family endonuclease [Chloroflexaceae bacterium]